LHWQREAVHKAAAADLWAWLEPVVGRQVPGAARLAFVDVVRGNILFPSDAGHWAERIFSDSVAPSHAARAAVQAAGEEFFEVARRALDKHGADFKAVSGMVKQDTGLTGKALFQPLRAALTGELDGPEMARLLPLIGLERARRRIARAREETQGA
jgi:glutamyl-tRNA synthetase